MGARYVFIIMYYCDIFKHIVLVIRKLKIEDLGFRDCKTFFLFYSKFWKIVSNLLRFDIPFAKNCSILDFFTINPDLDTII